MMVALTPIPDKDLYLYKEDEYIGKMDALDIHSVHMAKINKVARNTMESRYYDTSNPCELCRNTGNTLGECELLKKHDFLKVKCIQFSLCKKRLE